MTKQEKIKMDKQGGVKEGIKGILSILYNFHLDGDAYAGQIWEYLDSQGLMLKVVCSRCQGKRWVAITEIIRDTTGVHNETCPKCDGLGYIMEPLKNEGSK